MHKARDSSIGVHTVSLSLSPTHTLIASKYTLSHTHIFTHTHSLSLSPTHAHIMHKYSLSHTHTHTHTHTVSHPHTLCLSFSPFLTL